MRKEVIIAILLGLLVGLAITYGFYSARRALERPNNPTVSPSPSPSASTNSSLVLHAPADESVTSTPEVTVTGNSLANAYVVVFINDVETLTNADQTGAFSVSGTLQAGSNIISVHSLDENGADTAVEHTVILLTNEFAEINLPATGSAKKATAPSPSPSASTKPKTSPSPAASSKP